MATVKQLELEVGKIKQRNKRVEADKAWETSSERRALIAVLTYAFFVLFFHLTGLQSPWVNALIPTIAFLLSTLTLSLFKEKWMERIK